MIIDIETNDAVYLLPNYCDEFDYGVMRLNRHQQRRLIDIIYCHYNDEVACIWYIFQYQYSKIFDNMGDFFFTVARLAVKLHTIFQPVSQRAV